MITIIADDREREVIRHGQHQAPDIFFKDHLTTGDYLILAGETPLFIIERKTWADLASSIKDGRIQNVDKLKAYRDQTGAKLAYLIEGSVLTSSDSVDNISYRAMRSHLDHLMYRDNVFELRSTNPVDSACRLIEFARNLATLKPETASTCGSSALALAKKPQVVDEEKDRYNMWAVVPTIGDKTIQILLKNKYTWKHLFDRRVDAEFKAQLASEIGGTRAERIFACFEAKEREFKILSAVHGISVNMAQNLLRKASLAEMLSNWDQICGSLADIQINGKRVGKKRVEKLGSLLGI